MGDGVALRHQVVARACRTKKLVGETARTGIGRAGQELLGFVIVQRVIEPRDRTRGIAERRMTGDVLDPLAVDVDFAAVAQAFQIFGASEWPAFDADGILAFDPIHERLSLVLRSHLARRKPGEQVRPARPDYRTGARLRLARFSPASVAACSA